jgi:hypothetical protein
MILKINCKFNDNGAWCANKNIKRSLFGMGARCCCEYDGKTCSIKEERSKMAEPPKPIKK